MERCWVCDGMPVVQGCPDCLGRGKQIVNGHGGTVPCGRCHGKALTPITCPACKGAGAAPPPRRHDPEWHDPLECTVCHGAPECLSSGKCSACGNRGRIYLVFQESGFISEFKKLLSVCRCVFLPAHDPLRGAVRDCPICEGYGILSLARQLYLDNAVARNPAFLLPPPPDIAYAYLMRQWRLLWQLAPPLWPWDDLAVEGDAA